MPKQRQNLLFSATFSKEIKKLANEFLHNPTTIEVARENSTVDVIQQKVYRVAKAKKTGLIINDQSIKEFGMTFGVGIPVGNMFSNLNLALEVGRRGTTDANLVEEKFANFKMSLSLNDRWFIKRKYN